jgi:hypothetical protein
MTFHEACSYVGLEPTKRQRRKFENRRGLAYRVGVQRLVKIPDDVTFSGERRRIANDLMSRLGGK